MRVALAIVVVLGSVLVATAPADMAHPSALDRLRLARASLAAKDLEGARHNFEEADRLLGGHAGSMSGLASIAMRQNDPQRAMTWLDQLAATGLVRHIAQDSGFVSVWSDSKFRELAARFEANAKPVSNAAVAYTLDDPSLLTEDVVWDAARKRFLVSSIHRGKIVAIDAKGQITDYFVADTPGLWSMYALVIDAKRNRLWATTSAGPEFENYQPADSNRTALLQIDLKSGKLVARHEIPPDGKRHVLGDLAIGPDGTVYMTESLGGRVYRLKPGAAQPDELVGSGTFGSPQQPALSADGQTLFLADYPQGIHALPAAGGLGKWLAKPRTLADSGIDGLYRDGDKLIAIQNGTNPHRVLELTLAGDSVTSWRVLEQSSDNLGEPNHGVVVGKDFYFIGNSGWERVNEQGVFKEDAEAKPPMLLRLRLD